MTRLTSEQVQQLQAWLSNGQMDRGLRDELLDHLCCEVEDGMTEGLSFEDALAKTTRKWSPRVRRRLNRQHFINLKLQPIMLRTLTASFLIASCYWLFMHSEPTVTFSEPTEMTPEIEAILVATDPPTASPLEGVELADSHSGFGMRMHPIFKRRVLHRGMDFAVPMGTKVLSTAAGSVTFAGRNGDYGLQIRLKHPDGYATVYSHLSAIDVVEGDVVALGHAIGKVGSTGKSVGPHLHYELWKDDRPIDPLAMRP